jgi:hypothetical protein
MGAFLLIIVGAVVLLDGLNVYHSGATVFQEIGGLVIILIGCLIVCTAMVISEIRCASKKQKKASDRLIVALDTLTSMRQIPPLQTPSAPRINSKKND